MSTEEHDLNESLLPDNSISKSRKEKYLDEDSSEGKGLLRRGTSVASIMTLDSTILFDDAVSAQ